MAREGMSAMMLYQTNEQDERINAEAKRRGMTKTALIRALVRIGLDLLDDDGTITANRDGKETVYIVG